MVKGKPKENLQKGGEHEVTTEEMHIEEHQTPLHRMDYDVSEHSCIESSMVDRGH